MALKVMLVDDSAVIRGFIARALEEDPDLVISTTAANGRMAIQMAANAQPDIIILDIEMPEMDGITALPELLKVAPKCKVIMASTLTLRNATISMDALALGASDYVAKPSARVKDELDVFYHELRAKVRALGGLSAVRTSASAPAAQLKSSVEEMTRATSGALQPIKLVSASSKAVHALAIASSTGGPQALLALFTGLKGKLSHLPIFITQHMPPTFTAILAEQIGKAGDRPCAEAKDRDVVKGGMTYVAPGNFHMIPERERTQVIIRLTQDPPVNFCRPAADPMLKALSTVYGGGLLTAVLTGMGQDGMEGARVAQGVGGSIIAQDERSCVVWGMPKATAEAGICEAVLPLPDIAPYIIKRCGG